MKSLFSKRALLPFFLAGSTAVLLNCGGGPTQDFTADGDTTVTNNILGVWEGTSSDGRTYILSLCEDDSDRLTALSCETLHRVKGNEQGKTETTEEPTGCGGCDYDYSLYVAGSIQGTDLASTGIIGQFGLAGGDKNGPAFPYRIVGSTVDGTTLRYEGVMESADSFTLTSLSYPATASSGFDAGPIDSGSASFDAGDPSTNDVDASTADAGDVDAGDPDGGDVDAGDTDAGTTIDAGSSVVDSGTPSPTPSSSGSSTPTGPAESATSITFHRIGATTCPAPQP